MGLSNLNYALAYAKRFGWKVFPIKPKSKRPIYDGGFLGATNDEAQIIRWWTRTPDANIGLACGMSDVAVIDLDGYKAIELWNKIVESTGMTYVKCAAASTSSGVGNHLLYRQPVTERVRNTNSKIGEGIDTRGDGGYVLLEPSVVVYSGEDAVKRGVPDGYAGSYTWLGTSHPRDGFGEFPKEILEILREKEAAITPDSYNPPKNAMRMLQKSYEKVANAAPKTRNDTLYNAAFFLSHAETVHGERLNLSDVRETLLYAGMKCGLPRLEVEKTIESGIRGKR